MVSDSGEATLPDPVPPHQRGWGRGRQAPFRRRLRANPAVSEGLFLSPPVLIVGEAGLFGYTHFCVSKSCATEIWPFNRIWAVSRKGSNAPALRKKKKICRGAKSDALPSPIHYWWGRSHAGGCHRCI